MEHLAHSIIKKTSLRIGDVDTDPRAKMYVTIKCPARRCLSLYMSACSEPNR